MPDRCGAAACIAIIPARGGSKGISRKNLRLVGGLPLVARSIVAAKGSSRVEAVYVSTDDAEIAEIARQYGAEVIQRPADISGDAVSSEAALLHGLGVLREKGVSPDILVFLQCTSPLTTPEAIDRVVAGLDDPRFAMALSVAEDHGFLWGLDAEGRGYGLNHDATRPRVLRQELSPQFRETGAVYAMRTLPFFEKGDRFCGAVKPVPLDLPVVEVDSLDDLRLVEALLQAASRPVRKMPPPGIKALVMDFDGVHTDDCVYVDEDGRESVRCSRADGMGVAMLRRAGMHMLILSSEKNPVVAARARKLGIPAIQDCGEKKEVLEQWLAEQGLEAREIAYMGNDVNDLECMHSAGWSCCPADAQEAVKGEADYVADKAGGNGAVREIMEKMLPAFRHTCDVLRKYSEHANQKRHSGLRASGESGSARHQPGG